MAHPLAVIDELESAGMHFRATHTARGGLSQLAPISSLPTEILSHIFQLVANPCVFMVIDCEDSDSEVSGLDEGEVQNADNSTGLVRRRNKSEQLENFPTDLDCLSRVCSYWRQFAINTPSLWTHVDIVPHTLLHKELFARAETYIARAAPLPIELHAADLNPLVYDEEDLRQLLKLVHNRINSLDIAVTYCWRQFHILILEELFLDRTSASTGLTKLTTSWSPLNYELDEFFDWFEHSHDGFLHLTTLRLHGMFPVWGSIAYHNLVDLRLTPPSDIRWTRISESQLRSILEASPGLRILYFALHIVDRQPHDEPVAPVRLSDLELVSISTYRGDEDVLLQPGYILRMLAPGSNPLRLTICHNPDDDNLNDPNYCPGELVEFFRRSNIAKFCAKYSCPQLDQLLRFAPDLEELAFDTCAFGWQKDSLLKGSDPATPRSNSLVLHNCSLNIEHLEVLLDYYPTKSLILSKCNLKYIEDSSEVGGPVRQVSDLSGRYPATKFDFQASDPTASWNLIDCT
ncbi:F-box-like domain protein [Rhizoctonia solani 123E]|uniref:F-box-like domain protein n=1 Tax=Rhizoctonia solani 123E TaxID=1423351 RepID=A0A074RQS7_9AGAM|nr:F-box-like domain protein [Rhizoctonia solani 123E]